MNGTLESLDVSRRRRARCSTSCTPRSPGTWSCRRPRPPTRSCCGSRPRTPRPAWNCAPRLDVTSPVKRCGKSRLLDIIEATCHDPLMTVNISPAALVRSIGDDPPTLLLDEADTVFGPKAADNHEDLRGILNAGHSRNRPYIRWDMPARQPEHCPTFAMAALAGIGALPDTITDRAVVVKMRRRAPGEVVDRYRDRRDGAPLKELGERLGAWVRAHLGRAARRRAGHARRGPRGRHLGAADRDRRPRRRRLARARPPGRARADRRGRHRHDARRPAAGRPPRRVRRRRRDARRDDPRPRCTRSARRRGPTTSASR